MRRGDVVKTIVFSLFLTVVLGCGVATAQDPPPNPVVPPPTPVVTPPPTSTAPPATDPAQAPPAQPTTPPATPQAATPPPSAPAATPMGAVKLTEAEARNRREAIFVMEGVFVQHVVLAANATQREIQNMQPGLRLQMFSPIPPSARGNYLEDYGVFFHVQIPNYYPSVVQIIEEIAKSRLRPQTDPATPASLESTAARAKMIDPDAYYVTAVREYLVTAMLEQSKPLNLRPNEWLTVSARGDDGAPSQLSQPSIMQLRVKGSDLLEYLAGRITKEEVTKRVEVKGFSGSR
jgi:hypothetical protein